MMRININFRNELEVNEKNWIWIVWEFIYNMYFMKEITEFLNNIQI